jgi:hypothetical protein
MNHLHPFGPELYFPGSSSLRVSSVVPVETHRDVSTHSGTVGTPAGVADLQESTRHTRKDDQVAVSEKPADLEAATEVEPNVPHADCEPQTSVEIPLPTNPSPEVDCPGTARTKRNPPSSRPPPPPPSQESIDRMSALLQQYMQMYEGQGPNGRLLPRSPQLSRPGFNSRASERAI